MAGVRFSISHQLVAAWACRVSRIILRRKLEWLDLRKHWLKRLRAAKLRSTHSRSVWFLLTWPVPSMKLTEQRFSKKFLLVVLLNLMRSHVLLAFCFPTTHATSPGKLFR